MSIRSYQAFSKPSDVEASIASGSAEKFSAETMAIIEATLEEITANRQGFCTGCKYCLPCPQEIDIPRVMGIIAQDRFWGFTEHARARYADLKTPRADACAACGQCVEKCTQHLPIIEEMAYAAEAYSGE